jgi:hypothetical protein
MARNSLAYIPGFSVKFFFQPIYTDENLTEKPRIYVKLLIAM